MNDLSFEVLNIIYDFCPEDNYKIIDVNDIIWALPEGVNVEIDKLNKILEDLVTDGSILLKYRDEEDICLALTIKGRRIIKKERETRVKLEAQMKAKAEEEEKLRKIAEAAEKVKAEAEEKIRLEKIEKEKKLEEAKVALEELKAQKKSKKEFADLKQQVEQLEKDIVPIEVEQIEQENNMPTEYPTITSVQHLDFLPLIKKVGKTAFWGGIFGAIIGNAIFLAAREFLGLLG